MLCDGLKYRAVFISDLHLGSTSCKADRIRHFLQDVECDYLYLVGDIVDIWVGARSGKWKQEHTNVVRTILGKSEPGCKVLFTPGNHDALVRNLNGSELGNISVNQSFVHDALDGKRFLVEHGDLFDRTVTACKPLAWAAAWCYEFLAVCSVWLTSLRKRPPDHALSFCHRAKQRLKRFVEYFTSFTERITVDAHLQGFDGVVCGHIHEPQIRRHATGAVYMNCGDWVNHCTAIVERLDGQWELIHWAELVAHGALGELLPAPGEDSSVLSGSA